MKNSRYFPFERNNYFYGKLLTVRDFETEQKYFNDKRRLLNRLLFTGGVVCGLQVVAVDDKTISVETGMAIDYTGREMVLAAPYTQKLSMIEGFTNNEYTKNVYLCLAYDERGKEPVHSVAASTAAQGEIDDYNRIQEGCRIFIKEDEPGPLAFGYNNLVEETQLLYQDEEVRLWQKTPKYINPHDQLVIKVILEKSLQTSRVEFSYQLYSDLFTGPDGQNLIPVSFTEPDARDKSSYQLKVWLSVPENYADQNITGKIGIQEGSLKLRSGDRQVGVNVQNQAVVQLVQEPVREKILRDYFNLNLDQMVDYLPEQHIYLAKISLLHVGPTFMIEKVDRLPFDEYIYNTSLLYRLNLWPDVPAIPAANHNPETRPGLADSTPPANIMPPDVHEQSNEAARPTGEKESTATGVIVISLESSSRSGRVYTSDEINHGLGPGQVLVFTGLEDLGENPEATDNQEAIQIFYGPAEVFQKSSFETSIPAVTLGTVVYPKYGTFRIVVKPNTWTNTREVRVRWWVLKKGSNTFV